MSRVGMRVRLRLSHRCWICMVVTFLIILWTYWPLRNSNANHIGRQETLVRTRNHEAAIKALQSLQTQRKNLLTINGGTVSSKTSDLDSGKSRAGIAADAVDEDISLNSNCFWDLDVERVLQEGYTKHANRCEQFNLKVENREISHLRASSWERCGREGNAYGEFRNGAGSFCIRYRHPHNHLVEGEYFSFLLARRLGINTVPCVRIGTTGTDQAWPIDIRSLKWKENQPIAFIEWMPGLRSGLKLPNILLNALISKEPLRKRLVRHLPAKDRLQLAQWSDMIIFDYLIGHHDRFARLQDDSDKENKMDILQSTVPNLGIDGDGLLWFYDNEPGLLDAYALMYGQTGNADGVRFQKFHDQMLNITCVFRKETVIHVANLHRTMKDPLHSLAETSKEKKTVTAIGSLYYSNNSILKPDARWEYVRRYFRSRLGNVIDRVKWCSFYT